MRLMEFAYPCLLLLICGVCHPFSSEEDEYLEGYEYRSHRKSSLESLSQLSDISGEYQSDQSPSNAQVEESIDFHFNRSTTINRSKTSSSRSKTGRRNERKNNKSTSALQTSTRRKQGKNTKTHQKARYKIKSKDLDFSPGLGIAQRSCPVKHRWLTLYTAVNIDNDLVEVYQPSRHSIGGMEYLSQTFYTETCLNDAGRRDCPGCCKGIDHNIYSSSCKQRLSYVQAFVLLPGSSEFFWSHIKVNSSCVCEFAIDLP